MLNGIRKANLEVKLGLILVLVVMLVSALFFWKVFTDVISMANFHHDEILPSIVETACLNYFTEYDQLPSSNNQKLTAMLLGDNPRGIVFISLSKRELNANREMIDRWGTPLRITERSVPGESTYRVLVESAGPDKIFGTSDDITNQ